MRILILMTGIFWFVLSTGALADISDEELDNRLAMAAGYLARIQQESGQFRYEYDFVSARFSKKNSIVRQAGTAQALAEYLLASGDQRVAPVVRKAIAMLQAQSAPFADGLVVTLEGDLGKARTGTTALALLAVLYYAEATGDRSFDAFQADLVDGIAALQLPGGHFENKPGSGEFSSYFDGETWFALAEFNLRMPQNELVRDILDKADPALADYYSANPEIGFSHWGMLAASVRFRATGDPRFLDFLERQGAIFIDQLRPAHKPRVNNCYSIEGLGSAAVTLAEAGRSGGPLWSRLVARVTIDTLNNNSFQIMPGQEAIRLSGKSSLTHDNLDRFTGAFLNGRHRPQTRIDFTQHCMSAMLKYKALKAYGNVELKVE